MPREGFLFSGTILDNVRIARPDATDAEVAVALDGRYAALYDNWVSGLAAA